MARTPDGVDLAGLSSQLLGEICLGNPSLSREEISVRLGISYEMLDRRYLDPDAADFRRMTLNNIQRVAAVALNEGLLPLPWGVEGITADEQYKYSSGRKRFFGLQEPLLVLTKLVSNHPLEDTRAELKNQRKRLQQFKRICASAILKLDGFHEDGLQTITDMVGRAAVKQLERVLDDEYKAARSGPSATAKDLLLARKAVSRLLRTWSHVADTSWPTWTGRVTYLSVAEGIRSIDLSPSLMREFYVEGKSLSSLQWEADNPFPEPTEEELLRVMRATFPCRKETGTKQAQSPSISRRIWNNPG